MTTSSFLAEDVEVTFGNVLTVSNFTADTALLRNGGKLNASGPLVRMRTVEMESLAQFASTGGPIVVTEGAVLHPHYETWCAGDTGFVAAGDIALGPLAEGLECPYGARLPANNCSLVQRMCVDTEHATYSPEWLRAISQT